MRWIKASERMPVKEGRTVIKRLNEFMIADAALRKNGLMAFVTPNGMTWNGYKDFEWLDESIPTSLEQEAERLYPYPEKNPGIDNIEARDKADLQQQAHITCARQFMGEIEQLRAEVERLKAFEVKANELLDEFRMAVMDEDWRKAIDDVQGIK